MIVIDLETTGLNPRTNAIVSIGAVDLNQPERQFYTECRIWDEAHIDDRALEINGFTKDDITSESKEPQEVALRAFLAWAYEAEECTLAGHNVSVDISFLQESLERCGINFPFPHRSIDTHSLTLMHLIKRGEKPPMDEDHKHMDLNSDFVFKYVGLGIDRGKHNALQDAQLTAEAISRLLYNKPLLEEFKKYPIPWLG